ncbi:PhoX family phosphatase [Ectopseudomonas mendocina]|uniref:PhoX family phosphatase n=1 Tax=Ectopseudomonas mendocina TaxID=300 RepID=A0ABZ2RNU2_ECTME
MKLTPQDFHDAMEAHDNVSINPSRNPHFNSLTNPARRSLLKGGVGLAALVFFGGSMGISRDAFASTLLGFKGVPVQVDPAFDTVVVPEGYSAVPFFSWGDPVEAGAPQWKPDASDDWQVQERQAGDNHDGMEFFPFEGRQDHGLLVMNHEYINPPLHPSNQIDQSKPRPLSEVRKEQAAHGVSIIEVRKDASGQWQRVMDSRYNRRISTLTPMRIAGPLAGHDQMKTAADETGEQVFGTLNNCGSGFTPWGTYLTCEENWHNYFINRDTADYAKRISHKRYGMASSGTSKNYAWETADPRFNATPDPKQAHGGYVNEPHRFGWIVEIDPFDPSSKPIKRTAMGRFCHESVAHMQLEDGSLAFYSGDDSKDEYIYKFVPSKRFDAANPKANRNLLDDGVLYVARFDADGTGQWLALVHGQNGLIADNGFSSQAEVLLNTRAAADLAGATPMDRPEWVAVHPQTRDVYVTLTNNDGRGNKKPVDKANPRPHNLHGQIIRFSEQGAKPGATQFKWELFLLAGEQMGAKDAQGKPVPANLIGTINGDIFSSPDGLNIDEFGRIWIQTDFDDEVPEMQAMGCNQLLCADPSTREVRRFLVGPRGCEITGLTRSPDNRTMWINVQHPGISYPASDGKTRPRSTTVIITKNDGGIIGT